MNVKRIWAIFIARNYEFFRDRAAFGWNFAFPFFIIIGFSFIFAEKHYQNFTVGVFPATGEEEMFLDTTIPSSFQLEEHLLFTPVKNREIGEDLLRRHKIDLLVEKNSPANNYWINDSSPNGFLVEKIFLVAFLPGKEQIAQRKLIEGEEIRYIDWFFPGLLGMNMMFSALWGVGYVVVRYRKNGALKRLKATPLTALEYLSAQTLSRIFLLMFTLFVVWHGADFIFDFHVQGSILLIFFLFFLGGLSLSSLGLILAARGTSEEFTSGVLNFITWPMMFLSEVWFSLEAAPDWLKSLSHALPLTHMLKAVRKVMNEGAALVEVQSECIFLLAFTAVALTIAARIFSWNE
ncbi:MAG: ABC transporter permease [Desulfocapsaceae bacterium]|nr:ABC transporter permease [Desulfocapsaceae bacterium]